MDTLLLSPMDTALAAIRFHTFTGVNKGDLRSGWTSDRGAILTLETASDVTVVSGVISIPGTVVVRDLSSYDTEGVPYHRRSTTPL